MSGDFADFLHHDGRPRMPDTTPPRGERGRFAPRARPEAATEQTGQIDMAELFRRLDQPQRSIAWPVVVGLSIALIVLVGGACVVLALLLSHGGL